MSMYMTPPPMENELNALIQNLKKKSGTLRDFLTLETQRAFSCDIIPPKDPNNLSFDEILEKYGWNEDASVYDDKSDLSSMYPDLMDQYDAMRAAGDLANDMLRELVLK